MINDFFFCFRLVLMFGICFSYFFSLFSIHPCLLCVCVLLFLFLSFVVVVFALTFFSSAFLSSAQRATIMSTSLRILIQKLLLKFFETFELLFELYAYIRELYTCGAVCASVVLVFKTLVFNEFFRFRFVCMPVALFHSHTRAAQCCGAADALPAFEQWHINQQPNQHMHATIYTRFSLTYSIQIKKRRRRSET